jgi:hypothetical protein
VIRAICTAYGRTGDPDAILEALEKLRSSSEIPAWSVTLSADGRPPPPNGKPSFQALQKFLGLLRNSVIEVVAEFPMLSVTVNRKTKSRSSGNKTISGVAVFWPRMVAWLL